jgi:hypothetical protein
VLEQSVNDQATYDLYPHGVAANVWVLRMLASPEKDPKQNAIPQGRAYLRREIANFFFNSFSREKVSRKMLFYFLFPLFFW